MKTTHLGWLVLLLVLLSLLVLACEEDSDDEGTTDGDEAQDGDTNDGDAPQEDGDQDDVLDGDEESEENDEETLLDLSCPDAVRLPISGTETFSGIEYCPSRHVARSVEKVDCPAWDNALMPSCHDETSDICTKDEDCVDGNKHGICVLAGDGVGCACEWICNSDADCNEGEICPCSFAHENGDLRVGGGRICVPANCRTNDDCPGGECAASPGWCYERGDGSTWGFFCRYETDPCAGTYDCLPEGADASGCQRSVCTGMRSWYASGFEGWRCETGCECDGE